MRRSWRAQFVHDRALPVSACYLLCDPDFRPVLALGDGREDLIECCFIAGGATVLYRDPVQDMILPTDYEIHGGRTIMGSMGWRCYDGDRQGRTRRTPSLSVCPCAGRWQRNNWPSN